MEQMANKISLQDGTLVRHKVIGCESTIEGKAALVIAGSFYWPQGRGKWSVCPFARIWLAGHPFWLNDFDTFLVVA